MIRFIDGPHGGLHLSTGSFEVMSQWARYVFPDCGCEYFGFTTQNRTTFWYTGKVTKDEPVPEAFSKAFPTDTQHG